MQFALHYMGQTEHRMRRFLNEVSRHLRVGGVFIATTMDSRVLMQLLMGHAERSWVSIIITSVVGRVVQLCSQNSQELEGLHPTARIAMIRRYLAGFIAAAYHL